MGDTLLGGERSGTPIETRGATNEFANFFERLMRGEGDQDVQNIAAPFNQLVMQAMMNTFGATNTGAVAEDLLRDPADRLQGLFSSLRPFEAQQMNEAVAGNRAGYGAQGGRFGRNAFDAETNVRGRIGAEQMRTREAALLEANSQRGTLLSNLMQVANQRAQLAQFPFQLAAQFLQPGAPQRQEGILPGLIGAGINLWGLNKFLGNRPQTTTDTSGWFGPSPTFNPGSTQGRPVYPRPVYPDRGSPV